MVATQAWPNGCSRTRRVCCQKNTERKKKKNSPVNSYGTGASADTRENPSGICFGIIALLLCAHVSIPEAQPYTAKFFTLSYYNAGTGKYGAGQDDFYFMAFCMLLLVGLRAGCMESILVPLANQWGIPKRKDAIRFSEQGWMLIYYSVFWPLGMVSSIQDS